MVAMLCKWQSSWDKSLACFKRLVHAMVANMARHPPPDELHWRMASGSMESAVVVLALVVLVVLVVLVAVAVAVAVVVAVAAPHDTVEVIRVIAFMITLL